MKSQISFPDFDKLDLRVGEIVEAAAVSGSGKLVCLKVDFGPEPDGAGLRTIYAGIAKWYPPESLTGRKLIFVVNLEPKRFTINGEELTSQGMLVAAGPARNANASVAGGDNEAVLYQFDHDLPKGSGVH